MFFVKDGLPFIFLPFLAAITAFLFGRPLMPVGMIMLAAGLFFAYFFRDPPRRINGGADIVLSPADGKVLEVADNGNSTTVRIFLSVFNVHLQRSPVDGIVKNVEYRPGKCLPAMAPEAHLVNEQNIITIESGKGMYEVRQIAGILARRVSSWIRPGDRIAQGQKIGFIKFGSQVDITVPAAVQVKVKAGQRVTAGLTVIAELKA